MFPKLDTQLKHEINQATDHSSDRCHYLSITNHDGCWIWSLRRNCKLIHRAGNNFVPLIMRKQRLWHLFECVMCVINAIVKNYNYPNTNSMYCTKNIFFHSYSGICIVAIKKPKITCTIWKIKTRIRPRLLR